MAYRVSDFPDDLLPLPKMEGSGFLFLLEHERYDDLRRMYRLFVVVKSFITWKGTCEFFWGPKLIFLLAPHCSSLYVQLTHASGNCHLSLFCVTL